MVFVVVPTVPKKSQNGHHWSIALSIHIPASVHFVPPILKQYIIPYITYIMYLVFDYIIRFTHHFSLDPIAEAMI